MIDPAFWTGLTLSDGKYEITQLLGEGGMGFVYRALQKKGLNRDVVIKVPKAPRYGADGFLRRFREEVDLLIKLSHPRIVKILDGGEHEGHPFMVLEYLVGGTLADRLQKAMYQPMPLETTGG